MFYGLIVIMFAWLWQVWRFRSGLRSMDPWFLRLSALGMLIVAMDCFKLSDWQTWASIVSLVIILFLLYKIRR